MGERTDYTLGRTVRNTEYRRARTHSMASLDSRTGVNPDNRENLQSQQADGAGFEYNRAKVRDVV